MLSFVQPSSAPKTYAHWSQKTPAFRHAEKCRFVKNGTELVPRAEGELKALATAGRVMSAWPSAQKKIVAAMIATPKLLATASSLVADIKSKVKLQRNNRGAW